MAFVRNSEFHDGFSTVTEEGDFQKTNGENGKDNARYLLKIDKFDQGAPCD